MLKRLVFGTISYGYSGEIIDGEFTLKGKPRRRLKIDPVTERAVRLIFHLFVIERRKLNEIARLLNDDPSIPLPHLCRSGRWTNDTVRRVLTNTRYRGLWRYGVNETVYVPDADYLRKKIRVEPLKEVQIEALRIIADEQWFAAARLIAEHNRGGRKSKDGNNTSRPKVLNGIFYCDEHQRPLVASGAYGRHMTCPVCQCLLAGKRSLVSWLNRKVALRLTCDELARRICADEDLIEQVIEACRREADEHQRPSPGSVERLKVEVARVKRGIDFALKNPGETEEDQAESTRVVRELRAERARVESELHRLMAARNKKVEVPKPTEVRKLLKELARILADAGQSSDPSDTAVVRRLLEELTGGRIIVSQQGERKRQRGWLRGTFQLRLLNTVVNRISSGAVACYDDGITITIDYKRPLSMDAKAETAWRMNQDKKRHAEIANELGCVSSYITKLLKYYSKENAIEWIDGRSLRLNFPAQNRKPAMFKQMADKVMAMYQNDLPLGEIAEHCDVHVATVRKTVRWWHQERGLKVSNGRTRAGRIKREANRAAAAT